MTKGKFVQALESPMSYFGYENTQTNDPDSIQDIQENFHFNFRETVYYFKLRTLNNTLLLGPRFTRRC